MNIKFNSIITSIWSPSPIYADTQLSLTTVEPRATATAAPQGAALPRGGGGQDRDISGGGNPLPPSLGPVFPLTPAMVNPNALMFHSTSVTAKLLPMTTSCLYSDTAGAFHRNANHLFDFLQPLQDQVTTHTPSGKTRVAAWAEVFTINGIKPSILLMKAIIQINSIITSIWSPNTRSNL